MKAYAQVGNIFKVVIKFKRNKGVAVIIKHKILHKITAQRKITAQNISFYHYKLSTLRFTIFQEDDNQIF